MTADEKRSKAIANAVALLASTVVEKPRKTGLVRIAANVVHDTWPTDAAIVVRALRGLHGASRFPTLDQIEAEIEKLKGRQ